MKIFLAFVSLMTTFGLMDNALALPRFALTTGAKCASCHVNPTGGQMRNEYGISYSTDKLPLETLKDSDFTYSGKLNDNISIGGDYRSQLIYDIDSKRSTLHAMTTTLYGAFKLNTKVTFFYKQDLLNTAYGNRSGPEVFAIAKILPGGWYIKGGDFLPEYGWRLDDHTSPTRGGDLIAIGGLMWQPNYKDIGVEIGGYAGGLFLAGGLFNGTGNFQKLDFSSDKAYSGRMEFMGNVSDINFRVGASGYGFKNYNLYGLTAGIGGERVALFGELDWSKNRFSPGNGAITEGVTQMAAFAELDYLLVQGVWLVGRYGVFDANQGIADNEVKQLTLGFELFPYSFVELRPQYRINLETPSASNDYGLVQMHVWF